MEIWKDVKEFEGFYKISSYGKIVSLHHKPPKFLKKRYSRGYLIVNLSNKIDTKDKYIHVLVAESFLNHVPDGYKKVIDHIDSNKLNNNVSNLQIVTHRKNLSLGYKNKKTSSKYTGVCWDKGRKKWLSNIYINKKHKYLGRFDNEYDAHLAYQNALKKIENG